ncbi:hypothetical protein FF36_04693 [Frankia torreyi]|uniref:Uncharacterized protein n=1 Tax=Frankia torreyi TaxID=1856 RepID=A0A0D8BC94_9ACTN|nr:MULTISPECIES: DUF1684 domain-containing protein [Frankia]KJE21012.1 hypothetical protein FF36_04693 [Frankia torreyi]KQC35920.1 hypothetical protein UK82_23830 [Frankia sp. ACN1ag]KQM03873.1 hypothetical protein FF86_103319 [Frankia sp. CpI1-P]
MGFTEEWERWHARRVEALTAPFGPLSSLCRGRAYRSATSSDVAGLSWVNPLDAWANPLGALTGTGSRSAPGALRRVVLDTPLRGLGSYAGLTDQQKTLLGQEGTYGLGLSQVEEGAIRVSHGAMEVFEPHPDWVVPAVFQPWPDGSSVPVEVPSTKSGTMTLTLVGRVEFSLPDGGTTGLAVSPLLQGELHAVFVDLSRRNRFPFRFLRIPAPDDDNTTVLDFNRAVLPLAAFNDRIPAPAPPPGNVLEVHVTAGESHPQPDVSDILEYLDS